MTENVRGKELGRMPRKEGERRVGGRHESKGRKATALRKEEMVWKRRPELGGGDCFLILSES